MPTLTFLNSRNPQLRILNPFTLEAAQFKGGRLDIDTEDPNFPFVAAHAQTDPNIVLVSTETQCRVCGETFTGPMAKPNLAKHFKTIHPIEYDADAEAAAAEARTVILKDRAGFSCSVCQPVQTWATEAELSAHTRALHSAPYEMTPDGRPQVPDETVRTIDNAPQA